MRADRNLMPSKILQNDINELSKFNQWRSNNQRRLSQLSQHSRDGFPDFEGYNNKMGIGKKSLKSINSIGSAGIGQKINPHEKFGTRSEDNQNMSKDGSGSSEGIRRDEFQLMLQN